MMTESELQQEAEIRFRVEKLRQADIFECRVNGLKSLILAGHKFDWPYTNAFDDGGVAYHEAKRRIEEVPFGCEVMLIF